MRDAGVLRALCVALDRVDLNDVAAPALARHAAADGDATDPGARARDRLATKSPTSTETHPGTRRAEGPTPRGRRARARASRAPPAGARATSAHAAAVVGPLTAPVRPPRRVPPAAGPPRRARLLLR